MKVVMSPDELRSAQIQRQHSQEMAIRYLVANKSKASDKITWEQVVGCTDDFERDIGNSVAVRNANVEKEVENFKQELNGNLSLDKAIALKEKIEGAPENLHPMIKVKMGSMGIKGAKDLLSAVGQLTPEQAEQLDDYIDAQFDAS